MPRRRPVQTRPAARIVLAGAVALAHLGLLLLFASTGRQPEPTAPEPARPDYAAIPVTAAPPPLRSARPTRRFGRKARRTPPALAASPQPAAGPSPRWTLRVGPNGRAAGAPPAGGFGGPDAPDAFAIREALRTSIGCDLEGLKLRPDERERCDERIAKWAKKGRKIGPAADDPKRAAELAAQEDYIRRYNRWKSTDSGLHNGRGMLDAKGALGAMPPKRTPDVPPPPDIPE
jgi:hypothetical protein